jgi:hypothetical protein
MVVVTSPTRGAIPTNHVEDGIEPEGNVTRQKSTSGLCG